MEWQDQEDNAHTLPTVAEHGANFSDVEAVLGKPILSTSW